jgi:flagellar protein FlgJ
MKADNVQTNRFVLDMSAASDTRLQIKQDPQVGLKQAAQQFEGMLLQMMLKSMRDATPQDGLMDSDQTRFFTSILDQQLAQNMASTGSLGFAKLIEEQLGRSLQGADESAVGSALAQLQQAFVQRQAATSAGFLAGAGSIGPVTRGAAADVGDGSSVSAQDYVNKVWPHASEAAKSLGVPAHFLVAHSALESGWGKSEIRHADGSSTYNVFGIKAGRNWTGPSVEITTTEYVDGVAQTVREKFRAYASYGEAFQDYANLLGQSPRFSTVLGQQDGTQFARSLQQSGYATDPQYADKLGRIIGGATLRQALAG